MRRIYNGVDTSIFYNKNNRIWLKPRLLFFNSPGESKAAYLFLNILNRIAHAFDLYIVGNKVDHPYLAYHKPFIKDRIELMNLYNNTDILVFPSKAETFGLIPLEAMACGMCVITSDAAALSEIAHPDHSFVFESENAETLLKQVNTSLKNLEYSRRLGQQAGRFSRFNFSLESCHKNYMELYKDILKN